ncbi:HlyD family secretion protein [Novosphingopyxis sp.]|uniref:HlyD family secretion protein n=1 Tax=Novosphingopyxis sp. TaxID=2709690 RepID=UPI003B5A7573
MTDQNDQTQEEEQAEQSGEEQADAHTDANADESNADAGDDTADDQPKKKSLFKKPIFWIILIVVVAAIAIGGTLYYLNARQYESTDDAFIDAHIVRLAAEEAGTLVSVANVDNRHVKAGTVLAVIEPSGQVDRQDEAEANVRQANEEYRQALAQIDAMIAQRRQAASQARVPLAAAIKAQQDLTRYRKLAALDPNAVSGQQLDEARKEARQTAADAAAARSQIESADADVEVARKQANVAEAGIAARKASAKATQTNINNLRITAPIDGQVVNRQVNIGSYVSPGTQLLAVIPDEMWITANFKETQLEQMRIGQPVTIVIDAFPGVEFIGKVDSFQQGAGQAFAVLPPQNATGNYVKVVQRVPVRIVFDVKNGPDPRKYPIGPGMSAVPTVKVR